VEVDGLYKPPSPISTLTADASSIADTPNPGHCDSREIRPRLPPLAQGDHRGQALVD